MTPKTAHKLARRHVQACKVTHTDQACKLVRQTPEIDYVNRPKQAASLNRFVCLLCMCSLLDGCLLVLAIFADSFSKLLEETLPPLVYSVVFLQELNTNSTSQLQEEMQHPVSKQTNFSIKVTTLTYRDPHVLLQCQLDCNALHMALTMKVPATHRSA